MTSKPWPIRILAFAHIVAPLFNFALAMWMLHAGPAEYFPFYFAQKTVFEILCDFLLLPVAGIAIWAVKEWSYPVFLLASARSFVISVENWQRHPEIMTIPVVLGFWIFNLVIVTYFLIPAVRRAYFDRKVRWWEQKPRYQFKSPVELAWRGGSAHQGLIGNLSEGGVFIRCDHKPKQGDELVFSFQALGRDISARGKVAFIDPHGAGFGVECVHTRESKKDFKLLARDFRKQGLATRGHEQAVTTAFFDWLRTLLKTGKGLVPEAPKER